MQLGSPHRLSTIFRTNAQTSSMEGRWQGLMQNVDNRPWIKYVAILDSRTRPGHRALNGKVFRYDDPFWRTHRPPLGWNCRCRIRALSDRDLERRNITPSTGEGNLRHYTPEAQGHRQPQAGYVDPATGNEVRTDIGWGYDRLEGWTPPPGRYDPGLRPLLDEVIQDSRYLIKIKPMPQNDPISIIDERASAMLTALAARAVEAGPNSADGLLESLWISQERYRAHVAKRLGNDDIKDETDYALQTFQGHCQRHSDESCCGEQ